MLVGECFLYRLKRFAYVFINLNYSSVLYTVLLRAKFRAFTKGQGGLNGHIVIDEFVHINWLHNIGHP
jgi:hypothetical protein